MPRLRSAQLGQGPPHATPLGLPWAPCSRVTRGVCPSSVSLSGHRFSPAPSLSVSPCSPSFGWTPLTLEVAKVGSRVSCLSSKRPVVSPYAYPTPFVSENLCPVISAGAQASPKPHVFAPHPSRWLARSLGTSPATASVGTTGSVSGLGHSFEPLLALTDPQGRLHSPPPCLLVVSIVSPPDS